jgi:hypothetical protein
VKSISGQFAAFFCCFILVWKSRTGKELTQEQLQWKHLKETILLFFLCEKVTVINGFVNL